MCPTAPPPPPGCLQVSRLAFDLGVADKSATFMRIDAHTLDLQDLRLAYRQAGNSRRGTGLGKQVPSPGLCAPFWAPGPPPWAPVHAALEWLFPSSSAPQTLSSDQWLL